jgi:hypothetical protein
MGTDIRWFVERNDCTAKWRYVKPNRHIEFARRDHELFSLLAIGNMCDPIAECRGIPDGTCPEIREEWNLDYEGRGWHHVTHYTVKELLEVDWCNAYPSDEWDPCFFLQTLSHLAALGDPEYTRVVIWFDS